MRRLSSLLRRGARGSAAAPLVVVPVALSAASVLGFAACADADTGEAPIDPGSEAGPNDAGATDSSEGPDADAAEPDASALRCSSDFCLVDLPNPNIHGLTKWMFAGVVADPAIGVWAIANGVAEVDDAQTAQVLRFEDGAFQVAQTVKLLEGTEERNLRLEGLAGDGAGHLLGVGSAGSGGVLLHGDGGVLAAEGFDAELQAAWFARPGEAWVVGKAATIFHFDADAGWQSEHATSGTFVSVWGSGPDDVYVSGQANGWNAYGLLGHRTVDDTGTPSWSFAQYPKLQTIPINERMIWAGIAQRDGARFWASERVLARGGVDGGEEAWGLDAFKPPVALRAFWSPAKNDIWAVGNIGRVYHFDGTSWTDFALSYNGAPLTANLIGITGTTAGDIIVVGEDVALIRRAR